LTFVTICGLLCGARVAVAFDPNQEWGFLSLESVAEINTINNVYHAISADFDNDGFDDILW